MHTLPSIEEVAIYIWFRGVFGTTCVFGVLGDAVDDCEATEGVRFGVCTCEAIRLTPSGTALS